MSRAVALRTVRSFHWQCEEGVHQLTLEIMLSRPQHVERRLGGAIAHWLTPAVDSPGSLAALRTRDEPPSRPGPSGRLRCGHEARPKSPTLPPLQLQATCRAAATAAGRTRG